jgi:PhnB protein
MVTRLNPYINFRGQAREAVTFYASVFGGQPDISTFEGFAMPGIDEAEKDLVMHSMLVAPNGFTLMVSDIPSSMPYNPGDNITISLSGDDEAELRGFWDALADGGRITLPLEKAPWGDSFGQLTDRFGINWMVNITGAPEA